MSVRINFTIEGEKQISRVIRGVEKKDLRQAFERAGRELVRFFGGRVFDSEGSAIGEKWPSGPQYHGLVRSGDMKKNFRFEARSDRLEISNPTEYFKYHQSNRARKSNLPRRVMLKLDEPRRKLVMKEVQKEYEEELRRR